MTRQLAPILALLVGCDAPGPGRAPEPDASLTWMGGAVPIVQTSADQHHATLVLDDEGRTLLAHSGEGRVVVRMLDVDLAEDWAFLVPGIAHHAQVAQRPGGYLLALNAAGGPGLVFGQALDAGGAVGEPVLLSDDPAAYYPDLAVAQDRGTLVWAEGDHLAGAVFDGAFESVVPIAAPPSQGNVDPPSVRAGGERVWAVWAETNEQEAVVKVAALEDGAWTADPIEVDRRAGVGSGRAMIAVHATGRFTVAWRWFDELEEPGRDSFGAWVRTFDAEGAALTDAVPIGADAADRPVVGVAGRCVLAGWEEEGTAFLQLVDGDGALVGDPEVLDAPGTAQRLYLDARELDGALVGRVSWEGRADGLDLDLWVRSFVVTAPACI